MFDDLKGVLKNLVVLLLKWLWTVRSSVLTLLKRALDWLVKLLKRFQ
jgi:hypothetical protein